MNLKVEYLWLSQRSDGSHGKYYTTALEIDIKLCLLLISSTPRSIFLLPTSKPFPPSKLAASYKSHQTLGYALLVWHASGLKLWPLKLAPKLCVHSFISSPFASLKSPGWYTVTSRQVDGTAGRELRSVELSVLCTLPQHSTVCTRMDGKAWRAKHSRSMSGICCLMSSSIKPSGRDESSKPVHQPRLLYSNSH